MDILLTYKNITDKDDIDTLKKFTYIKTVKFEYDNICQVIYSNDNLNKFIIYKRVIKDDDTYTFNNFKSHQNNYTFLNLTDNDLKLFFRSMIVNIGIMITNDNKIKEYEYINNKDENNRGVLHLKSEDEEFKTELELFERKIESVVDSNLEFESFT